jgi:hypothetical protein
MGKLSLRSTLIPLASNDLLYVVREKQSIVRKKFHRLS